MAHINQNNLSVVSEIKISYKPKVKASERPKISGSRDVNRILREQWEAGKIEYIEEFKMVLLNRANRVLGIIDISKGGVAGTIADPKIIFGAALKANASSIILAHNHPSGNLIPSSADEQLTKKIKEGGKLLEIEVPDHIILTAESYFSFADDGML